MPTMGNEVVAGGGGAFFGTARADLFGRRFGKVFVLMTAVPAAWYSRGMIFIEHCLDGKNLFWGLASRNAVPD